MSADNGQIIKELSNGKYELRYWHGDSIELTGTFESLREAIREANKEYTEYGIDIDLLPETPPKSKSKRSE